MRGPDLARARHQLRRRRRLRARRCRHRRRPVGSLKAVLLARRAAFRAVRSRRGVCDEARVGAVGATRPPVEPGPLALALSTGRCNLGRNLGDRVGTAGGLAVDRWRHDASGRGLGGGLGGHKLAQLQLQ
eukprot:scaffold61222_cov71-Phaeocystis_antarctica.AAC.6